MNVDVGHFVASYLLFPVIVLILGLLSVVIAKKNKLLSDKKAVVTVLLSSLLYSLFGFSGFFGVEFMPYIYLFIQFMFLLVGFANQKILLHFIKQLKTGNPISAILVTVLQFVLAWAVFSIIFNFANDLQYGFWAGTCLLPLLFYPLFEYTYQMYLSIPAEIYKVKVYSEGNIFEPPVAELDERLVKVFKISTTRCVDDEVEKEVKGKALKTYVLGDWFGMIIKDSNNKHLDDQIELYAEDGSYGWIFYTERAFLKTRHYLDPDLTIEVNGLDDNDVIIAKRAANAELGEE